MRGVVGERGVMGDRKAVGDLGAAGGTFKGGAVRGDDELAALSLAVVHGLDSFGSLKVAASSSSADVSGTR